MAAGPLAQERVLLSFCVTLVLISRMTLADESNTHLALGRGVRGEGACAGGHGKERGSIQSRSMSCGTQVGSGQVWKKRAAAGWCGRDLAAI